MGYEYVIIASIISMLVGLNAKIIYDWLRSGRDTNSNNTNKYYITREVCDLKYHSLENLIRIEIENIKNILSEIKEEIKK